ncbi:MAG: site-specific DNA-methyltransferase [Deltaproteobacteria bacterium]|nr:site-specific DNA-methyltransferase [Deltaproteobacteria bacterium]
MKKLDADDPITRSPDLVQENLERMRELFPEAFTEGKVDFQVLRQLLGDAVDDRDEKYGLNWHGKRRARHLALTPSTGTLRPCPEDSVDWDKTRNLVIEGDNLEVLKLLQKSYAGKVKLIYIDPPYNTGKDFVYPDDYQDNIKNYLERTGQVDSEGKKTSTNTEASGRFHTAWLNMMSARLTVARNLLHGSGAIWISIDDTEFANVRHLCAEIFGEENFVAGFIWQKRTTRENRKVFSSNHDYVVCYARDKFSFQAARKMLPLTEEVLGRYENPDNDPRREWQSVSLNAQAGHGTKAQYYKVTTPSGRVVEPPPGRCWVVTKTRMDELIADKRVWFGPDGNNVPREKIFLSEAKEGLTPHTLWPAEECGTNDSAKKSLMKLFDGAEVFDTPKPTDLLHRIVHISTCKDDSDATVLDFFAGSGTTGHAVMAQNAADSGHRRFILVQLPEPLDPENKDQKTAADFCDKLGKPRNIAELTKERLRRAGKKIKDETPLFAGDLGFRVFKLDSSNIRAWDAATKDVQKTLLDSVDNLKPDRGEADILYELLLKLGLDLAVAIERREIAGKTVHSIGGGALLACLDPRITADEVEALGQGIVAWHQSLAPVGDTTCVLRDSAFADDVAKTNLTAILEQYQDDDGHPRISKIRSL